MAGPLQMRDRAPGKSGSHEERLDGRHRWEIPAFIGLDPHGPEEEPDTVVPVLVGYTTFLLILLAGTVLRWHWWTLLAAVGVAVAMNLAVGAILQRLRRGEGAREDAESTDSAVRVRAATHRALGPLFGAVAAIAIIVPPTRIDPGKTPVEVVLYLAALPLAWSLYRAFVLAGPGELEVRFTPHPARGGEDVQLRIAQGARGAAIRRMEIRLLCLKPKAKLRQTFGRVLFEDRIHLEEPTDLPTPGGAIELAFGVPHDAPASDPEAAVWRVEIRIWSGFGSVTELFDLPVVAMTERTDSV